MPTIQITFDAREAGAFEQQHDAFTRELRHYGLVVTEATGREHHGHAGERTETVIQLLEAGSTPAEFADTSADIRRAAQHDLHGTLPGLARCIIVYGPQGQHLLELTITDTEGEREPTR